MRKIIITMAVLLQVVIVSQLKAQVDPHFSQYYAYPLWLNPALTGVIDGDARVNANYKSQWATINNAYQTTAISADFRPTDRVGVGFNVLDQQAGDAGYNYLTAYGSFGYGIDVSEDGYQQVHFGLQAGIINRSFDPSKLQLDDQYNPVIGFDPTLSSFERFSTTNSILFDAGAGIYYFNGNPDIPANIFGGFSISHLNQPKDPFATEGISSTLPMRYTLHGGVRIAANEDLDITPNFIYMKQAANQERVLGVYAEFKADDDSGLILGASYRVNDAAIADAGYHFNNMVIGLSYDFNTSALRTASESQGGPELSISYIFNKHKDGPKPVCPRF